jgi:hypothetical protein
MVEVRAMISSVGKERDSSSPMMTGATRVRHVGEAKTHTQLLHSCACVGMAGNTLTQKIPAIELTVTVESRQEIRT